MRLNRSCSAYTQIHEQLKKKGGSYEPGLRIDGRGGFVCTDQSWHLRIHRFLDGLFLTSAPERANNGAMMLI